MYSLPLYTDGQYFYRTPIADNIYMFTITYVPGPQSHWVMDIADSQNVPILSGINLTMGAKNLLKGFNTPFNGMNLVVFSADDAGKDVFSLPQKNGIIAFFATDEEMEDIFVMPDRFDLETFE